MEIKKKTKIKEVTDKIGITGKDKQKVEKNKNKMNNTFGSTQDNYSSCSLTITQMQISS